MYIDNRSVGETNMNDHSSRSHTIFTLTIESRLRDEEGGDGTVKVASLVSIYMYVTLYMYFDDVSQAAHEIIHVRV